MLPHDTRWSEIPTSKLAQVYGPRIARELRRADVEGKLTDSDARIDNRGLHYFRNDPRLDSRPFSAREAATRPKKKAKRSRSRPRTADPRRKMWEMFG